MKFIKDIKVCLLFFGLTAVSCTDLDETVYSSITAEGTTLTADDLDAIIVPPYASLRDIYWGWDGMFDAYEESSDLIVTPARVGIGWGQQYVNMHQHTWLSDLSHIEALWSRTYSSINQINRAILQIEGLENKEVTDVYLAELRGMRAMCYYILYDNYRNIPLVKRFDLPEGFLPEQSDNREVYDFIVNELEEVMPLLSTDGQGSYGRFNQFAAKMTLAKMYINSEVYIGESKWEEAISEVQDIIDSGEFSLTPEFSDVFALDNENLVEAIFAIPYDNIEASGSYLAFKALYGKSRETFDLAGSPWGGSAAIPQFIDTYDEDDARLETTWLGGLQYSSSGAPILLDENDPNSQLNYTNYIKSVNEAGPTEGYRFVRYEIGSGVVATYGTDVPFYRYTDALMIKAECLLRLGRADEAASIVSEVMQGSTYEYGKYEDGEITNYEGGDDIEYGRFLDELAWEFVGEHHRKQDLIRFGVYTTKSWFSHSPNGDFRKIFPIPLSQMQTNSNLDQNPGY